MHHMWMKVCDTRVQQHGGGRRNAATRRDRTRAETDHFLGSYVLGGNSLLWTMALRGVHPAVLPYAQRRVSVFRAVSCVVAANYGMCSCDCGLSAREGRCHNGGFRVSSEQVQAVWGLVMRSKKNPCGRRCGQPFAPTLRSPVDPRAAACLRHEI